MLRTALPIGRYLGVEVRLHLSFLLLLAMLLPLAVLLGASPLRGIALWLALLFAVLVREITRALTAVYLGLRLRALFLLPIGGVLAFAPAEAGGLAPDAANTRWVTAAGPAANLFAGLLLAALAYAIDPRVTLLAQPWLSFAHILRSLVWMQVLLGVLSLLPTTAVPLNRLLSLGRPTEPSTAIPAARDPARPALRFGPATPVGLGCILAGLVLPHHVWLVLIGGFLLLGAQLAHIQAQAGGGGTDPATAILVREVMLTDFPLLSSSDTLRGALDRTTHSLHEVFPVVRGDRLVGAITRQTLTDRLLSGGDSYLQGVMRRSLPLATPAEPLADALHRASALGVTEFIPVIDDDALVGILTPQSLSRALQQIKRTRPDPTNPRQN